MAHTIRTFGDPVLKRPSTAVESFDDALARLAEDMIATMYEYRGVGVAAPQVGVSKTMFVYDDYSGSGARVAVNPEIVTLEGEWTYDEGCLSVPGMFFGITRPDHVVMRAQDLDGKEFTVEGGDLLGRILQHECDHLDGKLLLDRLDVDDRKRAMREMRKRAVTGSS